MASFIQCTNQIPYNPSFRLKTRSRTHQNTSCFRLKNQIPYARKKLQKNSWDSHTAPARSNATDEATPLSNPPHHHHADAPRSRQPSPSPSAADHHLQYHLAASQPLSCSYAILQPAVPLQPESPDYPQPAFVDTPYAQPEPTSGDNPTDSNTPDQDDTPTDETDVRSFHKYSSSSSTVFCISQPFSTSIPPPPDHASSPRRTKGRNKNQEDS